jgi:hypothetical protein
MSGSIREALLERYDSWPALLESAAALTLTALIEP